MNNNRNTTLDQWIFRQEKKDIDDSKEKTNHNITLSSLLREFTEKIRIPDIKDLPRKTYRIFEILPEKSKAVIVTEKAKVASAIARVLGKATKRQIKTEWGNILIFEASLNNRRFTIIPLRGHITEYTTIDSLSKRWDSIDPKLIIDPNSLKEVITDHGVANVIQREISNSNLLILATDADEEGANIGLEVYELSNKVRSIPAVQMWFISLNPRELKQAFLMPQEPRWTWAYAVKARRIIDAMVGFSATREITVFLQDYIRKLQTRVFSIGRVQTPTLYLIYLREKEIRNFKPTPYWVLQIEFSINNEKFIAKHIDSPFKDEKIVMRVYEKIKNSTEGIVSDATEREEKVLPPTPLNTTKILILINNVLGLSSKKAMRILEDLYLAGLITYPRTETDKYPENYGHRANLVVLSKLDKLGKFAEKILTGELKLYRNGTKMTGDHLPITPIDIPSDKKPLPTKDHLNIYELIVRRYLALFYPPAKLLKKKIIIDVSGEKFQTSFIFVKEPGFFDVYPFNAPKEKVDFNIQLEQILKIRRLFPPERKLTTPPPRLTEAELINLMERMALGTKSTRPEHIETLVQRKYITRKGRRLYITDIGYSLMSFLEKIWLDFVKPYFSARVHILMRDVMNNELDWERMVKVIQDEYINLFNELRKNKTQLKDSIISAINESIEKEKVTSCPKCGSPMIIRPTRSKKVNVLFCTSCNFSTIIPNAKKYIPTNLKCVICGGEPLGLKRKNRIVYMCPFCWREHGPCYKCPKLTQCPVSDLIRKEKEKYQVGKCDCGGTLIYVPTARFVVCDTCGKKYYLPRTGSIRLLKKKCEKHNLRFFSVREKTNRYTICIKCVSDNKSEK